MIQLSPQLYEASLTRDNFIQTILQIFPAEEIETNVDPEDPDALIGLYQDERIYWASHQVNRQPVEDWIQSHQHAGDDYELTRSELRMTIINSIILACPDCGVPADELDYTSEVTECGTVNVSPFGREGDYNTYDTSTNETATSCRGCDSGISSEELTHLVASSTADALWEYVQELRERYPEERRAPEAQSQTLPTAAAPERILPNEVASSSMFPEKEIIIQ